MKKFIKIIVANIDKLIVKLKGWKHIPYSDTNFFYLDIKTYKGGTKKLKDGTIICAGDCVAEIHIDNVNVKKLDTRYANLIRLLRGDLKALKNCFKEDSYSKIKAIYGISVFYDIAARSGFTSIEIDNTLRRFFVSLGENILRLSLKNGDKKARKKFIFSKECWISQNQINKM